MAKPIPTPNGCQHCGQERRDHYQRWTASAGWHKWTEPTAKQRGLLPRRYLRAYVLLYDANQLQAAFDLLEPFEDSDGQVRRG